MPIPHVQGERYLEKIQKEHLQEKDYFINFCSLSPISEKRRPTRHTFILRGLNSIVQKEENPRVFKEQYD
jgi:hypothetical protein|tara:strand:- start:289 stop:498 length:210 start_codon:yes stop_codon:yes gene_type:complete